MSENIKVSVIIPIFNNEKQIRSCLESVLLQNLQEIEVICINDGSTDGSKEIVSELMWTDDRLRLIDQTQKGIGQARFAGVKEAKGEFLSFIEPYDTYYNFKALESLYNKAKEHDVRICGGCSVNKTYDRDWVTDPYEKDDKYVFTEERSYEYREFQYDRGFHRFIFDRKLIFEDEQFFPSSEKFQEPVWFVKALHKAETFWGITECVYSYGLNRGTESYDTEKISDIIINATDVAKLAKNNGYERLLDIEKKRLIKENAELLNPYICKKDEKIIKLLQDFADLAGIDRIEADILAEIIKKRDNHILEMDEKLDKISGDREEYAAENKSLRMMLESQKTDLKEIKENMTEILKELEIRKKTVISSGNNVLPYPYYQSSFEEDGIKWTDLGDGRIEANGTATDKTKFILTPPLKKSDFKTENRKYRVIVGTSDVSSFTWYISGRVCEHKGVKPEWKFFRDITINDTDGNSGVFDIDTTGFEYFGAICIVIKEGRTLDHVIFKPEMIPLD